MIRVCTISFAVWSLLAAGCSAASVDPAPAATPDGSSQPVVADPVPPEQPSLPAAPQPAPPAIALPTTMSAAALPAGKPEAELKVVAELAAADVPTTMPAATTAPAAPADLLSVVTREIGRLASGEATSSTYPGLPLDDQRYTIAVTQGLRDSLTILSGGESASIAVQPLLMMADRLRSLAPLEIVRATLCMRVEAFGVYEPIEQALPAKRETNAVLYCEIAGFHSRQADRGMYETRLSQEAFITDAAGQVLWTDTTHAFVDSCRNRRRDFYVARIIRIPATLPPGEHLLSVSIVDQFSREVASAEIPITVVP